MRAKGVCPAKARFGRSTQPSARSAFSSTLLCAIVTSPPITRQVQALHPYSVPELVALPVERGLPAYLDWICAETAPSGGTSA